LLILFFLSESTANPRNKAIDLMPGRADSWSDETFALLMQTHIRQRLTISYSLNEIGKRCNRLKIKA